MAHRPEERYVWLDLARGASALVVCAGHLRLALMCGYGDLPHPTPLQTAFYVATGLSSQAVMVFFVLSGFLVGGSAVRAGPGFRFGEYLVARLTRLWVVLLPALVLTLAVDALTLAHAPGVADGAFHRRWTSGPEPGTYSTSLVTFLGNAAFVNTVLVPSFGTNGPLWTLACEFWYYVTFPLLARAVGLVGRRGEWLRRAAALALALAILVWLPRGMVGGFVVWLMGAAAAVATARNPRPPGRPAGAAALAGFGLALVYSKLDHFGFVEPVPSRYVIGLGFAALVTVLVHLPPPTGVVRWLAARTSDVSYSLYLVHFPLTIYVATRWYADRELTATPAEVVAFTGWMAVMVAAGWLFWLAFERHTGRVRAWVRRAWPAPRREDSSKPRPNSLAPSTGPPSVPVGR